MLNILSWNIRQGGGSRWRSICSQIASVQPQVLVLSEFRNNEKGHQIRASLLKHGYRHQYVSNAKPNENSVLIASTISGALKWTPVDIPYKENVLWVKFSAFTLIGGYFPHKKKHQLFHAILNYRISNQEPLVVVGDFNTGINFIDQKGKSFWYQDELRKLKEQGLNDAFRKINGPEVKEYSWFSHQGNGYRYDHSYVSDDLIPLVKDCYYLHEWREKKLSDHSPMILNLG